MRGAPQPKEASLRTRENGEGKKNKPVFPLAAAPRQRPELVKSP